MNRRLPNVRDIVAAVQNTVNISAMEKSASEMPVMTSGVAADMQKLARALSSSIISTTSYNEVMKFGNELKQMVQR